MNDKLAQWLIIIYCQNAKTENSDIIPSWLPVSNSKVFLKKFHFLFVILLKFLPIPWILSYGTSELFWCGSCWFIKKQKTITFLLTNCSSFYSSLFTGILLSFLNKKHYRGTRYLHNWFGCLLLNHFCFLHAGMKCQVASYWNPVPVHDKNLRDPARTVYILFLTSPQRQKLMEVKRQLLSAGTTCLQQNILYKTSSHKK